MDYSKLRDLLKEGKWREAEDETRAKLIEAAGPAAQKRNWVYWSEVKTIPVADMLTLDALWSVASKGRFGYKVQRQMWIQNRRQWNRFFRAIDLSSVVSSSPVPLAVSCTPRYTGSNCCSILAFKMPKPVITGYSHQAILE